MAAQSVSLSTMFGWIPQVLRMFRQGKGPLLAASLWTLLLVVLILLPFLAVMIPAMGFPPTPGQPRHMGSGFWAAYVVMLLLSLAIHPALTTGWFRLCAALDGGQAASGRDILAPFRMPELWLRALKLMLLTLLAVVVIGCVTMLPFWGSLMAFQRAAEAHQLALASGAESAAPMPPIGFFLGYFAFLLLAMLLQAVAMTAMAEVANRPTGAMAAFAAAARAVSGNLFKLILFGFCASALVGVGMIVVIVPLVLVSVALAFLSPMLSVIVVIAMEALLLLAFYPLMYLGCYLMWKDLMGGNASPPVPGAISV